MRLLFGDWSDFLGTTAGTTGASDNVRGGESLRPLACFFPERRSREQGTERRCGSRWIVNGKCVWRAYHAVGVTGLATQCLTCQYELYLLVMFTAKYFNLEHYRTVPFLPTSCSARRRKQRGSEVKEERAAKSGPLQDG